MLSSTLDMARKPHDVERQVHPKGERISVDNRWKEAVRKELAGRGWEQEDLAEKIPCSPATVTALLKPIEQGGSRQSRYARRVHQIFGWKDTAEPLAPVALDDGLRFVTRRWPALSETDRETVRRFVDSLTTKR